MPIDPNIALSVQGIGTMANPMQMFAQAQQLQLARQQALSLQQERQAQVENLQAQAQQREQIARQNAAVDHIMQTSLTQDPDTGAMLLDTGKIQQGVIGANLGHLWPQMSESIDKMNQSALATNAAKRKQLAESLFALQNVPDAIKPDSALTTMAFLKANGLMSPENEQAVHQALAANPTADTVNSLVQKFGAALPEYQAIANKRTADVAALQETQAKTQQALAASQKDVASTGQITRQQEISTLAAAPNAQAYAAIYAKLPPASQQNYPPPQAWTKQTPQSLMMMGLTPEQASQRQLGWAQLAETARKNTAELAMMDPSSPKNQERMEQQYATMLKSELMPSSRTGLGVETNKVGNATHLLTLFDQSRDAQGNYNINKSQYEELAVGMAGLLSSQGAPTDAMREGIKQRTATGDLNNILTYATGTPYNGTTQDVLKSLHDSIIRQGMQAQQNRDTIMRSIQDLAPSDLDPARKQRLVNAAVPVRMPTGQSSGVIYARDPQGKLHQAPAGTALPTGWTIDKGPAQ